MYHKTTCVLNCNLTNLIHVDESKKSFSSCKIKNTRLKSLFVFKAAQILRLLDNFLMTKLQNQTTKYFKYKKLRN